MPTITEDRKDYKARFKTYYYDKIAKDLAALEEYRKPEMIKYYIWWFMIALTIVVTIYWCLTVGTTMPKGFWSRHGPGELIIDVVFAICAGFWFLAKRVKKNFEIRVKKGVLDSFLGFFGDFKWLPKESIPKEEIEQSRLIGNITDLKADDYFEGTHKGLKFVISEANIWRGRGRYREQIFGGIFVKIEMRKRMNGHTIVTEGNSVKPLFSGLKHVELEDVEFNKMFNVSSTDQVESRYILTTTFMERLKNLKEVYKVKLIRASFLEGSILIAMDCNRDMFMLGDLNVPVTDTGEVQNLFDEFVAVLAIVDLLKLDMKTGL